MVGLASLLPLLLLISSVHAAIPPDCEWLGHAPICNYWDCPPRWKELARMKSGEGDNVFKKPCWTGEKTLCCKEHVVSADYKEKCSWYGKGPWCDGQCPVGRVELARGRQWTQWDNKDCRIWGHKKFCCDPDAVSLGGK